jgi:hypothetical protein
MSLLDSTAVGVQIILPLALIAWLAFAPLRTRVGFLVETVSTGMVLTVLLLVAVWKVPPWWAPYLDLVLWLAAVIYRGAVGFPAGDWVSKRLTGWIGVGILALFGVASIPPVLHALQGRNLPPDATPVDVAFPLGPGAYLVASGGADQVINGHCVTLRPKTERQAAYRGRSYAVDVIKIDRLGLPAFGWRPADPAAYAIYGESVHAPCSGTEIEAHDGMPHMPVPTTDTMRLEGNHVLIRCGDVAVLLAHLRPGSVAVAAGDQATAGQYSGDAGNSGQSTEPHLHIHAQRLAASGDPLFSGEPLFLAFEGIFPSRNDRITIQE